jgi:hypothetical protein
MEKAMDFLRRELSDLERLMKALESAMERKRGDLPRLAQSGQRGETSVFSHDPALSVWVD